MLVCFVLHLSIWTKDYIYRMVKGKVQQYLTKPNHCIWPIRTHYTFVSTNEQFAPKWRRPYHGTAAFNYYHPIYMILDMNMFENFLFVYLIFQHSMHESCVGRQKQLILSYSKHDTRVWLMMAHNETDLNK